MRRIIILALAATGAWAAPTALTLAPGRQQIVATFTVPNPAQCTVIAYEQPAYTTQAKDTSEAVHSGSTACNRAENIIDGKRVTVVIGKRSGDQSLATAESYKVVVLDTNDSASLTAYATTLNIPLADTHPEIPLFDPTTWDHRSYPLIDWSDGTESKRYVDPLQGLPFWRIQRPMKGDRYEDKPAHSVDLNTAWTNVGNLISDAVGGPFATYSGSARDPVFIARNSGTDYPGYWKAYVNGGGDTANAPLTEDLELILYGSATGTTADRSMSACLAYDSGLSGYTCLSPEVDLVLPTSTGSVTSPGGPQFQFHEWSLSKPITVDDHQVFIGTADVASSVVTVATGYLPYTLAAGQHIRIGDWDFNTNAWSNDAWYTVSQIKNARSVTLVEAGVNLTGKVWMVSRIGFRIRKKTTSTNTVTLNAGIITDSAPAVEAGANAVMEWCSPLKFSITYAADGTTLLSTPKPGRLCTYGEVHQRILFILADDGETRVISPLNEIGDLNIPGGPFSGSDPYTLYGEGDASAGAASFYTVVYNPSTCHYRAWTGWQYRTVTAPSTCVTWTPMNVGSNSTTAQLAAVVGTSPLWNNAALADYGFTFDPHFFAARRIVGGRYAVESYLPRQDAPCFEAVFDLSASPPTLVKYWDTFSGMLLNIQWSSCHSNGPGPIDNVQAAGAWDLKHTSGADFMHGLYRMQAVTQVSKDGGSTWLNDTSLSATDATNCRTNPYSVSGLQCIDLHFPSLTVCNTNPVTSEKTAWPCTWNAAYANTLGMSMTVGQYIMHDEGGQINGKFEQLRILVLTPDGSGGWYAHAQRWSMCDDIDSNLYHHAAKFYQHLSSGAAGSIYLNGWIPIASATSACAGSSIWISMSGDLAHTRKAVDSSDLLNGSHGSQGDGIVSNSESFRLGNPLDVAEGFLTSRTDFSTSCFHKLCTTSGGIENYPSLNNYDTTGSRASLAWDWRAVLPQGGGAPEAPQGVWGHTYTLQGGTNFTYLVNVNGPLGDFKSLPPVVFGSNSAFYDISSPTTGNVIDDSKPWSYCIAYKTNECRAGASIGNVYVVAPNAAVTLASCLANTYATYAPCVAPIPHFAGWATEHWAPWDDPIGKQTRRLTMGAVGPAAQYDYSTPHGVPDGIFFMSMVGWPGGQSREPLLFKRPPPINDDGIDRTDYIYLPVLLPASAALPYARVRFGYMETNTDTVGAQKNLPSYLCTSRQDECVTDASLDPFGYASSDTLTATNCTSGCSIKIPALSGRVVYYRIERSLNGTSGWIAGGMQAAPVQ